jgi:hypothetical protein
VLLPEPNVVFWQIVLKKSDFMSDRNFAEPLVRPSQIYVGDHITKAILNERPPQAPQRALH